MRKSIFASHRVNTGGCSQVKICVKLDNIAAFCQFLLSYSLLLSFFSHFSVMVQS